MWIGGLRLANFVSAMFTVNAIATTDLSVFFRTTVFLIAVEGGGIVSVKEMRGREGSFVVANICWC